MSCKPAHLGAGLRGRVSGLQLALVVAAAVFVPGCTGAPTRVDAPSRILRMGVALPEAGVRQLRFNLTSEPLLSFDNTGRPVPRLAERWNVAPDGLTWTFTLRRGLKFHDGSPVTANDIASLLEPELRGQAVPPGLADVDRLDAAGNGALVFRLRKASTFLADDLAVASVPPDEKRGGIGPFASKASGGSTGTLVAFPEYYRGRPRIDAIEVKQYPTVRAAWAAMMRDEVDMLYEVGREALDFVQAESAVQVYAFPRAYVNTLGFNTRDPTLRRKDVRRAINLAIDRDEIVRQVLRGRGRVAEGHIWPSHWAYDRSAPAYRFDPAEAARILDRAGFKPRMRDGRAARLTLHCLVPHQMAEFESMALVLQKQLFRVGIDLELLAVPATELIRLMQSGAFQTFLLQLTGARVLSVHYWFLHSPEPGQVPLVNWGYTAADKALDRIRYARSDEEVRAGVAELQRVLYDDPPAAFIAWDERARAVSRRFEIPTEPGQDILRTLWQWRPAPARDTLRAGT